MKICIYKLHILYTYVLLMLCYQHKSCFTERTTSVQYAVGCPPCLLVNYPARTACRLTISTDNITANINLMYVDEKVIISLAPGETFTQTMDAKYQTDNGIQNNNILIAAEAPLYIVVEVMDNYYTPPIFIDSTQILALPKSAMEYKYYLVSYMTPSGGCNHGVHTHFYTIAASEQTQIAIYARLNIEVAKDLLPHQTYTYVINGFNAYSDPTGKLVKSNKPISIISGVLCESHPDRATFITFIQPTASQHYVAPHIGNSANTGFSLRIIATVKNTQVQVDGDDYTIDEEGKFIHLDFSNRHNISIIRCNRTCTAYIITKSQANVVGAAMLSIIPTSEFYSSIYFVTPNYNFLHYLSIVQDGEGPSDDITLDGQSLAGEAWTSSGGFSYIWMEINKGSHWLQSTGDRGFATYVYGHSGYFGGGYGHSIWPGE